VQAERQTFLQRAKANIRTDLAALEANVSIDACISLFKDLIRRNFGPAAIESLLIAARSSNGQRRTWLPSARLPQAESRAKVQVPCPALLPEIDLKIDTPPLRGKIDLAFLRPEKQAPGLKFRPLRKDPLIVLMPRDHALAARNSIRPQDIAGETFIGVSPIRAPTLWAVINDYVKPVGVKPDHQAENLAMAISLVASTGGVSLLPLYAQKLLPKTVVSRPIQGAPPMVDLVIGYNEANTSPLLKFLLSKVDELKFRVSKTDGL